MTLRKILISLNKKRRKKHSCFMFIVVWNIIILLKYNVIIKLNLFDKQKKLPRQILSLAGFLPPFFFKKFVFHI